MSELVLIRAEGTAALVAEMKRVIAFVDRVPGASLLDVAFTCSQAEGDAVVAFVTESLQDLRARLASASARIGGGSLKRLRDKSGT